MSTKKSFHIFRGLTDIPFSHCPTCLGEKLVALGVECTDCKGAGMLSLLQVFYKNEIEMNRYSQGE